MFSNQLKNYMTASISQMRKISDVPLLMLLKTLAITDLEVH